jgi:glycosyltransferase involved in cell wall biosynthesis
MVEAFRDAGHEVVVDCLPGCDPCEAIGTPRPEGSMRVPGLEAKSAGHGWVKAAYRLIAEHSPQFVFGAAELLYNIPLSLRLWTKLRRRPGIVYERYALGNFAPAYLCRALGIPLVIEVNDSVVIERSRPTSLPRIKRSLEGRILSSANLIVTISQRFKAQLLEAFSQLPESKILVLPNAVSERRFKVRAAGADANLRTRLGLGNRILLGTAGQFLPWHGLASLVSATADLARERDLGFLFIGDGPVRAEVMEAARRVGVEDRVTFTGMVPHVLVPAHLALLEVAVIPSSNEHCSPMKLMEFMAMGLPVVAPDLSNIREVLEDGRTGRLFRPGDMDDMRRHLMEVLDDREAGRAMGRRARDYILNNLTWTSHARKVLEALAMGSPAVVSQLCTS